MTPGLRKLKLGSLDEARAGGSSGLGTPTRGSPFASSSRQRLQESSSFAQASKGNACETALRKLVPKPHAVNIKPELFVLAAVVYGVLFFSMGKIWLPGNAAFCSVLIWAASLLLAEVARWLRLPRVVGMLGAGLLLANLPHSPVAAFPKKWGVQMRAAALATIFLRCGLELEFKTMNMYKWPALRLAFIPGVIEAVFDAGIAVALFGMPYTLALSMGFILKAVGPGLVVPAMFQLQKEGLGADKGVPSTVVIAASFDDIIAITGFSIFINIAIAGGENAAWQMASGPLQVLFGILGGLLAGVILGCTRIWDNKYKRFIGLYGSALLLMFFLEYFDMLSGGALGSLFVGLVACFMWERGVPRRFSNGPNSTYAPDIERVMAKVWNWVMEPLLFGTIGASIQYVNLSQSTIPKALLIVCSGVVLRVISTFIVMFDRQYTWRERTFYAIAWTPKATVQASLSAVPLAMITTLMAGRPDYDVWFGWGQDILTTGIFAIIICGSLGTLGVFLSAPLLLKKGDVSVPPASLVSFSCRCPSLVALFEPAPAHAHAHLPRRVFRAREGLGGRM
ncbi:MAG: Sodium/hydrogen exchanger family-domain-containing protein [Monoraphidium minutum]|nr:MAG: Sodium/hydrogen exchanger family-domain-containing protein [Monoraphidium minutum]